MINDQTYLKKNKAYNISNYNVGFMINIALT